MLAVIEIKCPPRLPQLKKHKHLQAIEISIYTLSDLGDSSSLIGSISRTRGTQREYSLKPLKHSIVERSLVFKR